MWARILGAYLDIASSSVNVPEERKQTFVCKCTKPERKQSALLNFDSCSNPQKVWVKGFLTI